MHYQIRQKTGRFSINILYKKMRTLLILLLSLTACLADPRPLLAQKATIEDIIITNSDSEVLVYFSVADCMTDEILDGVHNGIPATFTFYIDLQMIRNAWPDHELASHTFSHTLTYDSLKEEYHVFLSEKNKEKITTSLEEAKKLMTEANGFKTTKLAELLPDRTYQLMVKVKLAEKTLPLYFHYLIPFSSLWDIETDWYTRQFKY